MWRIRRKAKRVFNNLFKIVVLLSVLLVTITILNGNTDIPAVQSLLQNISIDLEGVTSWFQNASSWIKSWGLLIVACTIIIIVIFKAIPYHLQIQRIKRSDIRAIDQMTGDQFEEFLVFFFRLLGYSAKKTKKSRDQGADVILNIDGVRIVVQAKRMRNKVSNSAVQEVVASKAFYQATDAWVVTNSYYTEAAKELGRANNVQLWDRDRLIAELSKININKNKQTVTD